MILLKFDTLSEVRHRPGICAAQCGLSWVRLTCGLSHSHPSSTHLQRLNEPLQVDCCAFEQVLQLRLLETSMARPASAVSAHELRNSAFVRLSSRRSRRAGGVSSSARTRASSPPPVGQPVQGSTPSRSACGPECSGYTGPHRQLSYSQCHWAPSKQHIAPRGYPKFTLCGLNCHA